MCFSINFIVIHVNNYKSRRSLSAKLPALSQVLFTYELIHHPQQPYTAGVCLSPPGHGSEAWEDQTSGFRLHSQSTARPRSEPRAAVQSHAS